MKKNNTPTIGAASLLAAAFLTTVVSAQNVGIGTTTPKSKLSVNGSTASGGMAIGDATYTSTTGTIAPLNGAMIQGNVGIGTTAPTAKLDVEDGNIELTQSFAVRWGPDDTGDRIYSQLDVGDPGFNSLFMESRQGIFFVADTNNTNPTGNYGFVWSANSSWKTGVPQELMRLNRDGSLGIGDADPTEARLVVRGSLAGTAGAGRGFTSASGLDLGAAAAGPVNYSIYTSNAIAAGGNVLSGGTVIAASSLTPSDNRLKNIIGESNAAADLQTLNKIKVTDYTMKDTSVLGSGQIKKVIAQQVEEVYPQAISKTDGYLPDIYASGTSLAKGNGLFKIETGKALDLKAGDKVKVFTANGEPVFGMVKTTDGTSFTANLELVQDGEKVFVYGRKVNDLRTVDYEAIAMLNVSATQELAKKVASLEAENAKLRGEVARVASFAARLDALESNQSVSLVPSGESTGIARAE
ncbi:MAG: tail fiber domain-containing protein [Luteolibacter sp.]|uniref:tail fiber domain-containing protein n=1 Tax=Luteolibacter sp. TaxID=1962973 RepID=UPI00326431BB